MASSGRNRRDRKPETCSFDPAQPELAVRTWSNLAKARNRLIYGGVFGTEAIPLPSPSAAVNELGSQLGNHQVVARRKSAYRTAHLGAMADIPFHVRLRAQELKLTAKPKAFGKPFSSAIVEPFLKAINKKQPTAAPMTIDNLEAIIVGGERLADPSALVGSLVPPDSVPDAVCVELVPREERKLKLVCNGVQLEATLPPDHVHVPLRDAIVGHFLTSYNKKFSYNASQDDVEKIEVEGAEVDASGRSADLLSRKSGHVSAIVLTLTAAANKQYPGYANVTDPNAVESTAGTPAKPIEQVFRVRCDAVELKVTLPAKGLAKSLREAVITPFLTAYAKKMGRGPVTSEEVTHIEADGLAVADSLRASSLVSGAPVVRVELFLRPPVAPLPINSPRASTQPATDVTASTADEDAAADGAWPTGAPTPTRTAPLQTAKPNVDYSKWKDFDDGDDEEGEGGKKDDAGRAKKQGAASTQPRVPMKRNGKAPRSYADWGKIQISDDEDEAPAAPVVQHGRELLRDPDDQSKDWMDEAEALFGISREKTFGFALEYPRVKIEDSIEGRAGKQARVKIDSISAAIDEFSFEACAVQEFLPGGAYVDETKKTTRCMLWMPKQNSFPNESADDPTKSAEEPAESEGLPLVIIAHGALSHSRGPHTMWLAWYLVRQHGCAVLAVDHLPHHGIRTPFGSGDAADWPAADLSAEDSSWGGGAWEATLRRSSAELGFAMDVVLALPSAADMQKKNAARRRMHQERQEKRFPDEPSKRDKFPGEVGVFGWLRRLVDRSRMRLAESAESSEPGLIDPSRVGIVGFGFGSTSALAFLASDEKTKKRVRAAVLGFSGDVFVTRECIKERSSGGLSLRHVDVPGTIPSPPAAAYSDKVREYASKLRIPVHFVAHEKAGGVPLESSKALFDALGSGEAKRWHQLPGAKPMSVAELGEQMAAAPPKPRPKPAPKPAASQAGPSSPPRPSPLLAMRRSARSESQPERPSPTDASEPNGATLSERASERASVPTSGRANGGAASSGKRMSPADHLAMAMKDIEKETASHTKVNARAAGGAERASTAATSKPSAEIESDDDEDEDEDDDRLGAGMDGMMAMVDAQMKARQEQKKAEAEKKAT